VGINTKQEIRGMQKTEGFALLNAMAIGYQKIKLEKIASIGKVATLS
jgi:hypothetical protein